jgi:hypothetical protein
MKKNIEVTVKRGKKCVSFIPKGKMTKDLLWSLWNEIMYKLK